MVKFESCGNCEVDLFDVDAQAVLCKRCDGENNFREIDYQFWKDALNIDDDWCQACFDWEQNKLPVKYQGLNECPLCGTIWNEAKFNISTESAIINPICY